MAKPHVADTDFVLAWQSCNGNPVDVAAMFSLNPMSVRLRAKRMIAAGIPLKAVVTRPRGRKRTADDISRLVALISENPEQNS